MITTNELNYSPIEKLCLALVFSIQKLKHYFQAHGVRLVSRANPIKFVMSKNILSDRLARWYLYFQQFEIVYIPHKVIKGQALAKFLANHPIPDDWELSDELPDEDATIIKVQPPWKMYFDGSTHCRGAGAGVVFVTSRGEVLPYSFTLMQLFSNNVVEYQALILRLEMVVEMKQLELQVFGDSQLVINQILVLPPNEGENEENELEHLVVVSKAEKEEWRQPIIHYLSYGILPENPRRRTKIRRRAPFFLYYKDTLCRRSFEGVFLRCLGEDEALQDLQEASGAEVVALKEVKKENVASFIQVYIIYCFCIPRYITTDNGNPFDNRLMNKICELFGFKQRNSSMYNIVVYGLTEAFNKTLCNLLKKVISKSKRGKFTSKWDGPYVVQEAYSSGAYKLVDADGMRIGPINGKFLKKYYP
ncbi:uncharacterized protein [Nicotiana sylvestris]|uniref:uncharacterized protein n=1 Tax=Nicotiana sylvestris TaxID=4096 RepID=UPI00388C8C36